MFEERDDQLSRDRKGAVFAPETLPLPHGRGSERGFLNALLVDREPATSVCRLEIRSNSLASSVSQFIPALVRTPLSRSR